MKRNESNFIVRGTREADKMNEESLTDTLARRFLLGDVEKGSELSAFSYVSLRLILKFSSPRMT
jgi:hypothetical protein